MSNAMANSLDSPLYSEAVYGIRNTKMIAEAPTFSARLPKRFSKNSGIVALLSWRVMMRVRRPRITHASSEPISALPTPTHVDAMPYRQPNCPA